MIEARNVTVTIEAKVLLDDLSITVRPGRMLAVVGPNGAGKSTLRKVLCGDRTPNTGEVVMGTRPLNDWSLIDRARVRAVLPQDSTLSFPFTSLEVVLMGRTPHLRGIEGRVDHEIARAALDVVEARHLEQRLYPTLSGGERQRVQFARVLAQIWEPVPGSARYLLLDEPTSNLDLAHQHSSLNTARRLAHEGVGVVVILHDLNLASQYCDDIVMLKDGRAVCSGTPSGVLTDENILSTFGVKTLVMQHPTLKCPLVITVPPVGLGDNTSEPALARR